MTIYLHNANSSESIIPVHESHKLQRAFAAECKNCWGCSCHSPDILLGPCQNTVPMEFYPIPTIDAVSRQAERYGRQISLLEDSGMEKERNKIVNAWIAFHHQLKNTRLGEVARLSFKIAYMQ